jgi:hypothetical protein
MVLSLVEARIRRPTLLRKKARLRASHERAEAVRRSETAARRRRRIILRIITAAHKQGDQLMSNVHQFRSILNDGAMRLQSLPADVFGILNNDLNE